MQEEYTTQIVQHGACTIVICRPILTAEEKAKREQAVKDTLGRTLHSYITRKEQNKKEITA